MGVYYSVRTYDSLVALLQAIFTQVLCHNLTFRVEGNSGLQLLSKELDSGD